MSATLPEKYLLQDFYLHHLSVQSKNSLCQ